jgi:hypothetical protein
MLKTYKGSCHCGAARFEADLDLAGDTMRCNCSICTKSRMWLAFAQPAQFRLLEGEDALADYTFGRGAIHHRFCTRCGVKPFGQATMPDGGVGYAVNLACLDDVPDEVLAAAPLIFRDGRHDDWEHPPAVTAYL